MSSSKYQAIIWDIDNVLLETAELYRESQNIALRELGIETANIRQHIDLWDRLLWYFDEDDFEGILRAIIQEGNLPLPNDELLMNAILLSDKIWDTSLKPPKEIPVFLQTLVNHGVQLGIVSNGDKQYQLNKLRISKLSSYFDPENVIIFPRATKQAKPNPGGILECCKVLKVKPKEALYVGDRVTDIIAANLAGSDCAYIERNTPDVKNPPNVGMLRLEQPTGQFESVAAFIRWFCDTFPLNC